MAELDPAIHALIRLCRYKDVDVREESAFARIFRRAMRGQDGVLLNRTPIAALAALAVLPAFSACNIDPGSGYLEIKALPPTPVLYLDQAKLDPIRNGNAVLREKTGTAKLQADIDGTGRLAMLCSVEIKKNRITTVTISVVSRQPRCLCARAGAGDTPANRVCIG